MKNALEDFRANRGLTFEGLASLVCMSVGAVWKHCREDTIPAEAAISYHLKLGIPLTDLRPDLKEAIHANAPVLPAEQHAAPPA